MDEEGNDYIQQLEKLMSSEVAATFWAPTMDILVISTFDNLLQGYRISFKAQRFFQIQESQAIQTLCFSPDSQLISYSLVDGSTKIILTETGEKVISVEGLGCQDVKNLNFVSLIKLNPQQFMPFVKNSIQAKLIPNISPHKNCNKNAIIKINYFNQITQDFTCLLLSERKKTWLLLNGFIPIAAVNYQNFFPQNQFRCLHCHLSDKLYSIVAEEIETSYKLHLMTFNGKAIKDNSEDIVKFNCLMANISQIFSFIDTTYSTMEAATRDIIRQYNSKINLIDDCSSPDISPCQQLMHYLTIGLASGTLTNFFTKEVYDSKLLQKLDETLTALFAQLHDVIIQSVQNGLERATILLDKLINYSKIYKFTQFGLITQELTNIEQMIKRLYILGEILLVESTEAKFNIRNLLVWLNKSTIKTCQENETEIQNAKSFLNKYTVDYNRLFRFLSVQDNFKLQNLLNFFRKTDDSIPLVIPKPQFKILSKNRDVKNPEKELAQKRQLEKELGIQDIVFPEESSSMEAQYSFKSIKIQMKELLKIWKDITDKPASILGNQICQQHAKYEIGTVQLSQMFEFQPKFITKDSELYFYYIEQGQTDRLIQYNCSTQLKSFLYTSKFHILSVAVAEEIICVLEEKCSQKKLIIQVINEKFDGSEIEAGKTIDSCQGDLQVDSSWRGLNSLVVDKTKLVIFD